MSRMGLKYGLEDKPPFGELMFFGLQWLAITFPAIMIIGKVVSELQFNSLIEQVIYLQKVSFLVGISLFCQVFWGHRLPLVIGPAAVLLVGIVAAQGSNIHAVYTSILLGGIILFILAATGLFAPLIKLFTPRVVVTILLLIAFTLTPTILSLIAGPEVQYPVLNICFALGIVFCAFIANCYLPPFWKSTLIIWLVLAGSVVYYLISPLEFYIPEGGSLKVFSGFLAAGDFNYSLDPGVLVAFLFCFLALLINDMGSIQAVGEMLQSDKMQKRLSRGICFTGLTNVLSGLFGVIGMVNFSFSPGVIAATGCASRFTLIPAAVGLILISFSQKAIAFMGNIPGAVIGSVLLYIMSTQIVAGLMMAFRKVKNITFEGGLVIGLPLILGIIISFLPSEVTAMFPANLRPILGNGFVVGSLTVLILDHLVTENNHMQGE